MNRLQKKCLIAAAGTHFLLVVVLLCSGFIKARPNPDDSKVLEAIPTTAVDKALQSGVRNAQPPPPKPPTPLEPPPPPTPMPPTPTPPTPPVTHVEPPKPVEPIKPPEPIEPKSDEPVEPKPKPHKIEVNLTPMVHNSTPKPDNSRAEAEARAAEKAAQRARDARNRTMEDIARAIQKNTTSATTVDLPGDSSAAYANYASIVKSIYTREWTLPDNAANDEAIVKVSVTIARDGHVIEAHIVDRSGDSSVDTSVQHTLDRVRDIAPFPDDATDKERTYIINFNLKAKRMLG